ncbi:hypothetical protein PMSD_27830 [Paenibacillus macquariensis subsp. defensor]|nr:hypothetical protein PMSD_27830 [Paenibacillus macquariensis subsp. defensor]
MIFAFIIVSIFLFVISTLRIYKFIKYILVLFNSLLIESIIMFMYLKIRFQTSIALDFYKFDIITGDWDNSSLIPHTFISNGAIILFTYIGIVWFLLELSSKTPCIVVMNRKPNDLQ